MINELITSNFDPDALSHLKIESIENCTTFIESVVTTTNGESYEIVICPTSNNSVMQPQNLLKYYAPKTIDDNPPQNPEHPWQIVVPIQSDGSCAANCSFCRYGQQTPTPYTSPKDIVGLLTIGMNIALDRGLVEDKDKLKLSLLKGGDVSLHPNFENVVRAIANSFPNNFLKLSSVASSQLGFFGNMTQLIIELRNKSPNFSIALQISANSTNEVQRLETVNGGSNSIRLYTLEEIQTFASFWRKTTDRRLTITFTLHEGTIFDPNTIMEKFNPADVVIKMRRIHPFTGMGLNQFSQKKYFRAYLTLVENGFNVIAGNPSYSELRHKLSPRKGLDNRRSKYD